MEIITIILTGWDYFSCKRVLQIHKELNTAYKTQKGPDVIPVLVFSQTVDAEVVSAVAVERTWGRAEK